MRMWILIAAMGVAILYFMLRPADGVLSSQETVVLLLVLVVAALAAGRE